MTPRIQLAVLDLLTAIEGSTRAFSSLLGACLAAEDLVVRDDDLRAICGLPLRRGIGALFQTGHDLFGDAERGERVHAAFLRALGEHYSYAGSVRERRGVTPMLATLRLQGIRVAVGTNLPRAVADVILASLEWDDIGLLATSVASDEVDDPRPRPGVVLEAMSRTGITNASRVMTIGSSPAELAEGTLARCGAVIGVTFASHTREELELRPHTHLVDRFTEIPDLIALSEVRSASLAG